VPDVSLIKVYGEFYGGIYPNLKNKFGAIQTTIVYTPDIEFEAFDLFYDLQDGTSKIMNYKTAVELFKKSEVPYAHIQAEGTLK
jgi:hypothetical protein